MTVVARSSQSYHGRPHVRLNEKAVRQVMRARGLSDDDVRRMCGSRRDTLQRAFTSGVNIDTARVLLLAIFGRAAERIR